MADLKKYTGQQFMAALKDAAQSKEALLELAAKTLNQSHEGKGYSERGITDSSAALKMQAAFIYAKMITPTNEKICTLNHKDLSTDQRLILVKHLYQKFNYGDFDTDFKKAYPKEYGAKNLNNKFENTANLNPAVRNMVAHRISSNRV